MASPSTNLVHLDDRDREILSHLRVNGGADIEAICKLLRVTRTAVRQRLGRMETAGFVVSALQSQSRGRPKLSYRVTVNGSQALGENYRDLVEVLWGVISGVDDEYVRAKLLAQVRDALASRFRGAVRESDSISLRVDRLAEAMRASGYRVQAVAGEFLPILRETCCPFPALADADEAICQVERQAIEQVLGAPVEFRSKCRDGHGCCEFQVLSPSTAGNDLAASMKEFSMVSVAHGGTKS